MKKVFWQRSSAILDLFSLSAQKRKLNTRTIRDETKTHVESEVHFVVLWRRAKIILVWLILIVAVEKSPFNLSPLWNEIRAPSESPEKETQVRFWHQRPPTQTTHAFLIGIACLHYVLWQAGLCGEVKSETKHQKAPVRALLQEQNWFYE